MAKLNPDVPQTNTPMFIGLSQPLSPFALRPDRTGYETTTGIASVLGDVAKGADNTIKAIIDNKVNEGVDTQREGYTGALEQIAGIPQTQRVGDIQPDQGQSLVPTQTNVPAQVQTGANQATSIVSASQSGKLTPTYYTGRLDMVSKDLRSQFPGYRDYIDQRISAATGGNPANEYVRQLLSQINQNLANNRTEMEKNLNYIRDNAGIPGAQQAAVNVQNGTWGTPDVVKWGSQYKSIEAKAAMMKADLETKKIPYEEGNLDAQKNINTLGDDIIGHSTMTLASSIGNTAKLNFNDIPGMLNKIADGSLKLSEDEARKLSYSFSVYHDSLFQQLRQKAIESGASKFMKPEEIDAAVNAKLNWLTTISTHLTNQEYGPAFQDFNAVKSITDATSRKLMEDTGVAGKYFRVAGAANKIGGPNAGIALTKDAVADGLPAALRVVADTAAKDIATQSDPNHQPVTMSQWIDTLNKAGVGVGDTPGKKAERATYDAVTNLPKRVVSNPDIADPLVANVLNGTYGAGNEDMIKKFAKDSFDSHGNLIPGQMAIFRKLTGNDIADKAYKLGQAGHPEVWNNYKTWTTNTFSMLFGDKIRDINTTDQGMMGLLGPNGNPNVKFTYNSETNHIGVQFADTFGYNPYTRSTPLSLYGSTNQQVPNQMKQQIMQNVAEINSGIDSMKTVAHREGTDVNAFVLQLLRGENLDPQSIGFKIQKAVESSQPKAEGSGLKRPDQYLASVIPQSVKDYVKKAGDTPISFPTLQDFTGKEPKPADVETNGIKGTANAAHVSTQWGNPLSPDFKAQHLTDIEAPNGQKVQVNKIAAQAFQGFLGDLAKEGYNIKSIGGYALREKKGAGGISQHAFGNAIDINPDDNPQGGSKNNLPKNVSDLAAKWGLTWGGDWSKRYRDPMHFEFTGKMPQPGERGYKLAGNK